MRNKGLGGVLQEGTECGRYMAWYPIIPLWSSNHLGLDLLDETGFFKQTVWYLIYATTPAPTHFRGGSTTYYEIFPFNDDGFFPRSGNSAGSYYLGDFMLSAAQYWPSLGVGHFARQWVNATRPEITPIVQSVDPGGTASEFTSLPLDYYASGPQFLYARNQWGSSATVLHFQAGVLAGVGHQHADYGNLQIWRNGYWLSRESTGYSVMYVGWNGTSTVGDADGAAHNSILINPDNRGCVVNSTCHGGGGPSISGNVNGPAVVRRLESQPAYTYIDVDLTAVYSNNTVESGRHKERNNPAVQNGYPSSVTGHVEREIVFIRPLETTVVFDRLLSVSPDGGTTPADSIVKTFVAHCEQVPTFPDATHANCTNGSQALQITTLLPASPTHEYVKEGGLGQYRIEINDPGTTAQSYFLNVLQAKDATAAPLAPTLTISGSNYTVHLNDAGNSSVTFVAGFTSSGGSVNIQGVGPVILTTAVEPISYLDSGPRWGDSPPPASSVR